VVRPYAVTRGRARPVVGQFDLLAYVIAEPTADPGHPDHQPEHRAILHMLAAGPATVAELASRLNIATGVLRVLLGDLLAAKLITVHAPAAVRHLPDDSVLKAVIDGLRTV
jgi:Protein of unknown function (DUF742).